MKDQLRFYPFLFVIFLFLGISSVELFSDGMFMDGLLYADISRNMAFELGTFWKPHLTYGLFSEFYGHPPLAFWLESRLFKVFGDSIYVERGYALCTYILTGYLIVLIWGKLTRDKKNGWIPLLFWLCTNGVTWALANNMLENTMSIFVCASVLFYLNSFEKCRFLWVALAGLSLFLGVFTKGLVCLYIWGLPFFYWVFIKKRNFFQMAGDTTLLVFTTILPIALLFFTIGDARSFMLQYFDTQIVSGIKEWKTVDSRFFIVGGFLNSIITPLAIAGIIVFLALKKKVAKSLFKQDLRTPLLFLALTLSGVFPIMITLKQSKVYILTVFPFFAISLGYYLYPVINVGLENFQKYPKGIRRFKFFTLMIATVGITLSLSQINRVGRDKDIINDCKVVIELTGHNQIISICPDMYPTWNLHGYLSRYGNISLDTNQQHIHPYYLSKDGCNEELLKKHYKEIDRGNKEFKLYKLLESY